MWSLLKVLLIFKVFTDRPNEDIVSLNNTLDEMDLTDIYRAFHPKEAKYTFFSMAHGIFSKIDCMIAHKTNLNKFKKIEIISNIFSNHKGLKLEPNPKGKNPKHSKSWRLTSMLVNNEWVKTEIREVIKNFLETNENKLTTTQNLWDTAKAVLRGKFIMTQAYLKKNISISNKQPNLIPTRTQRTTTKTAQSKQKEGNNQEQSRTK